MAHTIVNIKIPYSKFLSGESIGFVVNHNLGYAEVGRILSLLSIVFVFYLRQGRLVGYFITKGTRQVVSGVVLVDLSLSAAIAVELGFPWILLFYSLNGLHQSSFSRGKQCIRL